MKNDDYPIWVCSRCAVDGGGRRPQLATFHMDICGVCNLWKNVTEPRDYGYPTLTANRDNELILKELNRIKKIYEKNGDGFLVDAMQRKIERETREKDKNCHDKS